MGDGGGGEEFLSFSSPHFSPPSFPFSPDTQASQAIQRRSELGSKYNPRKRIFRSCYIDD